MNLEFRITVSTKNGWRKENEVTKEFEVDLPEMDILPDWSPVINAVIKAAIDEYKNPKPEAEA